MAASTSSVFRSGSLRTATSRSCWRDIFATACEPGRADPLASPRTLRMRYAVGGVLYRNANERSSKMVTTTGTMSPRCPAVAAS
jgi:hypothetical protein